MTLVDTIQNDIKSAMKNREKEKLTTLRSIKTAFKNYEIEHGSCNDEQAVNVLVKLSKQRKESITQFTSGGRSDLAEKEQKELEIIQQYLPEAPDEEQMQQVAEAKIQELGASSMKDMGKVMAAVKEHFKGQPIDGKTLSTLVKKALA